jgi:hypothetical protein
MHPTSAAEVDRATGAPRAARSSVVSSWERTRTLESVAVTMLLLAALWLLMRPYTGIVHDARLYLLQGLLHLYPSTFADDLFFKFGSQDGFQIFGVLLAPALARFSPETINLTLTLIGEVAWIAGAATLASVIYPEWRMRALAVGLLFALPSAYAGASIFHYGEGFFTPRPFAEAAILFAIAACLRERWLLCAFACAASLVAHPLMAAPGIFLIFCMFASRNWRWWLVPAFGCAAILILCLAGIEPFIRLKATMSGAWLEAVMHRSPGDFFAEWMLWDVARLLLQGGIVAVAIRSITPLERRLAIATGLTITAGALATAIGDDLLHNVLIIDFQPTRVFWLFSFFANLLAGAALFRLFVQRSRARWHFAAALVIYALFSFVMDYLAIVAFVPLAIAVALVWTEHKEWWNKRLVRCAAFSVTLITAEIGIVLLGMTLLITAKNPQGYFTFVVLAGFCIVCGAAALLSNRRIRAAAVLSLVAICLSISVADRRDSWERFIDASAPMSSPAMPAETQAKLANLVRMIGDAKQIYWEDTTSLSTNSFMWFVLGRPVYWSCLQSSGIMFYEKTAMEYRRIGAALRYLDTDDFIPSFCLPRANPNQHGPVAIWQIIEACQRLPDLDMLWLLTKVPDYDPPSWEAPAFQLHYDPTSDSFKRLDTWYEYDCRKLRSQPMRSSNASSPTSARG